MALWGDAIKVMQSEVFAYFLKNGNHEVARTTTTEIPSGANLNDYTTKGDFYSQGTRENSPGAGSLYLEVKVIGDLIVQEATLVTIETMDEPVAIYTKKTRVCYNGFWTSWKEI